MLIPDRLALMVGRWVLGDCASDPSDPEQWVYDQWRLEFSLAIGWLGISILLGPLMLLFAMIGDAWTGNAGNQIGLDTGTAIVSFALVGSVVHLAHMLSLRIYWIATSRPRSLRPDPWSSSRPPSTRTRLLLASTPVDLLIQVMVSMIGLAILLQLNP